MILIQTLNILQMITFLMFSLGWELIPHYLGNDERACQVKDKVK